MINQTLTESMKWTTADLELLSNDEWKRYEIIAGELFVTRAPHWKHQEVCGNIYAELRDWSRRTNLGQPAMTPGIIYTESDNVIPDVVWVSREKLATLLDKLPLRFYQNFAVELNYFLIKKINYESTVYS